MICCCKWFIVVISLHHFHHLLDFCLLSVGCLNFGFLAFLALWLLGFLASSISRSVVSRFLYLPAVVVVVIIVVGVGVRVGVGGGGGLVLVVVVAVVDQ